MREIEAGGETYEVTGNPSMGVVKYVQEMQIGMMREYLDDEQLLKMEEGADEEVMREVMEDVDVDDLMDMMWNRSSLEPVQTICLGTNRKMTMDSVMDMSALDFKELFEASKNALGGSAQDFIEELGIVINSQERMQEMVEDQQSNGSSDDLPKAVSDLSNVQ